jgi:hypothetical protein
MKQIQFGSIREKHNKNWLVIASDYYTFGRRFKVKVGGVNFNCRAIKRSRLNHRIPTKVTRSTDVFDDLQSFGGLCRLNLCCSACLCRIFASQDTGEQELLNSVGLHATRVNLPFPSC